MSINYTRLYHQDITIWRSTPNEYGGYSFQPPEYTVGRWQVYNELFRDNNGDESVSQCIAYLPIDVSDGDWLYEGVSGSSDPSNQPGAYQIRKFLKSPDIRNVDYTRKAIM